MKNCFSLSVHEPQVKIPSEWKGHCLGSQVTWLPVLTLPLTSSVSLAFELLCVLASSLYSGDNYALPCISSTPALPCTEGWDKYYSLELVCLPYWTASLWPSLLYLQSWCMEYTQWIFFWMNKWIGLGCLWLHLKKFIKETAGALRNNCLKFGIFFLIGWPNI